MGFYKPDAKEELAEYRQAIANHPSAFGGRLLLARQGVRREKPLANYRLARAHSPVLKRPSGDSGGGLARRECYAPAVRAAREYASTT